MTPLPLGKRDMDLLNTGGLKLSFYCIRDVIFRRSLWPHIRITIKKD